MKFGLIEFMQFVKGEASTSTTFYGKVVSKLQQSDQVFASKTFWGLIGLAGLGGAGVARDCIVTKPQIAE